MTERKSPKVTRIDFRDYEGKLIWTEPMILSKLFGLGDLVVEKGIAYKVHRVAVADEVQHVNLIDDFVDEFVSRR